MAFQFNEKNFLNKKQIILYGPGGGAFANFYTFIKWPAGEKPAQISAYRSDTLEATLPEYSAEAMESVISKEIGVFEPGKDLAGLVQELAAAGFKENMQGYEAAYVTLVPDGEVDWESAYSFFDQLEKSMPENDAFLPKYDDVSGYSLPFRVKATAYYGKSELLRPPKADRGAMLMLVKDL